MLSGVRSGRGKKGRSGKGEVVEGGRERWWRGKGEVEEGGMCGGGGRRERWKKGEGCEVEERGRDGR